MLRHVAPENLRVAHNHPRAVRRRDGARRDRRRTVPADRERLGDLDLTSEPGARHLAVRLEKAAKQVCAVPDSVFLNEAECRREAVARAIHDLARGQLAGGNSPREATKAEPVPASERANSRP
jgi:UrcA family protein